MISHLLPFLVHWGITALSLWLASRLFKGLRFDSGRALLISALLLGLANAIVRPVLVVLTFPLTLVTFGLFLLVINALMLLLVARLVRGFTIAGFGTAFLASIFVGVLSIVIGAVASIGDPGAEIQMPSGTVWL
ncbi:phage holin family protein [Ramlibacter sp. AN1133]|uniref:phage holin family protein n=1 Tax=Ramlibacter sp. AN1133 TaxID=3133429 RepID=UPI0030BD4927